ncbi:facilitated trehalose transporter Tret1-like [Tribolium madens]|uniref:facilitated trehalose transporter Tret1-like n=1 Tax=Tribolium madens TaxID=41895 RepID=UPI001CF7616D|nr:facilitated trehalose transporter Tret1-like [Tribolium madens]
MTKKINWGLYFSVVSINLTSFITGAAYSWTSPVIPKLNNPEKIADNPFGRLITPFEESWLASLISVGAAIGPILSAIVVDKIGRKKTLLVLTIPMIIPNLVLAFAKNINLYYFSRFFLGLGIGSVYSIVPIYVGEIAEDTNRGTLGCCISVMYVFGTVFCFIIGPLLTIKSLCLVLVVPAVLFVLIASFYVPESPYYLLMVGRKEEAEVALRKLRKSFDEKELEEMTKNVELSKSVKIKFGEIVKSRIIRKGVMIGSGLIFFQQCSGITVIVAYMQSIFEASGSSLKPEICAIIIGMIQLSTNLVTSQLIDRLGRRILLLGSLIGMFLSHVLLGLYFWLKINHFHNIVSHLFWVPVCSLIFYFIMFTTGVGPVSWSMLGEIFPTHVRSHASTFVCCFCSVFGFFLTLFFPNLAQIMGLGFTFWGFAGCCLVGVGFVWRVVPETRGKSLLEIQQILEYGSIKN